MESDPSEPLEPDAILDPKQQEEIHPVHADAANPELTSISARWLRRVGRGGGRRSGANQETTKHREERQRGR